MNTVFIFFLRGLLTLKPAIEWAYRAFNNAANWAEPRLQQALERQAAEQEAQRKRAQAEHDKKQQEESNKRARMAMYEQAAYNQARAQTDALRKAAGAEKGAKSQPTATEAPPVPTEAAAQPAPARQTTAIDAHMRVVQDNTSREITVTKTLAAFLKHGWTLDSVPAELHPYMPPLNGDQTSRDAVVNGVNAYWADNHRIPDFSSVPTPEKLEQATPERNDNGIRQAIALQSLKDARRQVLDIKLGAYLHNHGNLPPAFSGMTKDQAVEHCVENWLHIDGTKDIDAIASAKKIMA